MRILQNQIEDVKARFSQIKFLWFIAWGLSLGYALVYLLFIKARLTDKFSYEKNEMWFFLVTAGFFLMVFAAPAAVLFGKIVDNRLAHHHWACFSVLAGLTVWLALNVAAMTALDCAIPHNQSQPYEQNVPAATRPSATSAPATQEEAPPH